MDRINIKDTDLKLSRLGLGCVNAGVKWDGQEAFDLFDAFLDMGGNVYDTARVYSDWIPSEKGRSERVLGQWLAHSGKRHDVILVSKGGHPDMTGPNPDMHKSRVSESCLKYDLEESLRVLVTDYIDIYQVHNPSMEQLDQVLAKDGALEALQEAKKAGKIGHLGLTAHSVEVFERALDLDWVETIMFPYNIVEGQGEELIAECKKRNIGFIDMKPLAGGAIENGTLALRYICSNPNVTIVIPGMAEEHEMEENIKACLDSSPLSQTELDEIRKVREQLGTNFCRRCNYCAPCSAGISIPNVFLFAGYLNRYDLGEWARSRYSTLQAKASDCIECGVCETRCPYHLPIRKMMKECAEQFGE